MLLTWWWVLLRVEEAGRARTGASNRLDVTQYDLTVVMNHHSAFVSSDIDQQMQTALTGDAS